MQNLSAKRKAAGKLGGLSTLQKHGRGHFSAIGKRGAASFWRKYSLVPVDVSGWALVERATGKVKSVWG